MRQIIFLLLISSIASGQSLGRYPFARAHPSGAVGWTNLVGHWSLIGNDLTDHEGSDDMSATNAVNSADTAYYFDGNGDYLSFTGTVNTECTFMIEVYPLNTGSKDIFGSSGGAGAIELVAYLTTLRLRVIIGGGSGTSMADLALTANEWNWVSIAVSDAGNTVKYGVDGSYETETDWTETTIFQTNRVGSFSGANDFYGYIRNVWKFSDIKAESYTTAMEGRDYADGDPE